MQHRTIFKLAAVGALCAVAGAGAGIASSSASPPTAGAGGRGPLLRRAVHGDIVVATGRGSFATATFDRGRIVSVSGDTLTVQDGTRKANYGAPVTLTIPTSAKVHDNGHPATLSELKPGERVVVVRGPVRTWVAARD